MKINLDYIKINDDARRTKRSPHYIIKKKLGYRECKQGENDCRQCESHRIIGHEIKVMQCEEVGINATDYFAIVDKDHICNNYEGMKSKIDCDLSHDYKNYIPFIQEEFKNEKQN
jgi:hypothetical protein